MASAPDDLLDEPAPPDGGPDALRSTSITLQGGSTTLLRIGLTGDTRPASCASLAEINDQYPWQIIDSIADAFEREQVDMVVDLGDHMCVCDGDYANAAGQMALYAQAMQRFSGPWFMTLGNHECGLGQCVPGSHDASFEMYMRALQPTSDLPYYSVDFQTALGRLTLVVIADNAWTDEQQAWLERTLSRADKRATYTIVARHHPPNNPEAWANGLIEKIVRSHRYALFVTGHDHQYQHLTGPGHDGRDAIFGIGGAIQWAKGAFHGYALLEQRATGELRVSVYDIVDGRLRDVWAVGPNR